jgi:8-oxo-dGTP pyrophosphatase MutT (NUDIX family)
MKKVKAAGIQYAALPYRLTGRRLEILLVTSRETRRWVLPKGWPMPGLKPHEAAAIEAEEEAGLIGQVEDRSAGAYNYLKTLKDDRTIDVQVTVFPLLVTGQHDSWKEQGQREPSWFAYERAASLVAEPNLRRLIREFGRQRAPSTFVHTRLSRSLPQLH